MEVNKHILETCYVATKTCISHCASTVVKSIEETKANFKRECNEDFEIIYGFAKGGVTTELKLKLLNK